MGATEQKRARLRCKIKDEKVIAQLTHVLRMPPN